MSDAICIPMQDKSDFELSTLPALVSVFTTAAGETLLLLVKHADLIINKVINIATYFPSNIWYEDRFGILIRTIRIWNYGYGDTGKN